MVDKQPISPCGSAGTSKPTDDEVRSEPASPTPAPSAPLMAQNETSNLESSAPIEPDGAKTPLTTTTPTMPILADRAVPTPSYFSNSQPNPMSSPTLPQNGTAFPASAAPSAGAAVHPMPYMGFYPTVMPMSYAGYHPHPVTFPAFANGAATPQQYAGSTRDQPQFNSAYMPPAEMAPLPGESTLNRLEPLQPLPGSASGLHKEACPRPTDQLPLPSIRSLENGATWSAQPSQVPQRCRSPLRNPPFAKRRRLEIGQESNEIQGNGMNWPSQPYSGNGMSVGEIPKYAANAPTAQPQQSEKANTPQHTGSTLNTPREPSAKPTDKMNINDIVHPPVAPSPQPNKTFTAPIAPPQSAPSEVPNVGSQHAPTAPYPDASVPYYPPHMTAPYMAGFRNRPYNYFGNPHHNPFKHYPSLSNMFWKPVYQPGRLPYGSLHPGQSSDSTRMHPHPSMDHSQYPAQHGHPMPGGYPPAPHSVIDPARNVWFHGYASTPSQPPEHLRQHAVQIAPAQPGSWRDRHRNNPALEYNPNLPRDPPFRIYDLEAILKLGCKVVNWRIYNEQNHPVCGAPRENGTPCRRNVSRSACKWHGAVVPLSRYNTKNGVLNDRGNLPELLIPQTAVPVAEDSENHRENERSVGLQPPEKEDMPEAQSRSLRWNDREHFLFLLGYRKFGKSWAKIARVVQTRSTLQTQSHAQKFFERRRKTNKKKTTIHDLVFESARMQAIYNKTPKKILEAYLKRAYVRTVERNTEEQPSDQEQPKTPDSDEQSDKET